MTERFTVSMSDDGYAEMEDDRESRGLSRSAYVEQAVRESIGRNTKIDTLVEALTMGVAIAAVMMVISAGWMLSTVLLAGAVVHGDLIAAGGLFAASVACVFLFPWLAERLKTRQQLQRAKRVEA